MRVNSHSAEPMHAWRRNYSTSFKWFLRINHAFAPGLGFQSIVMLIFLFIKTSIQDPCWGTEQSMSPHGHYHNMYHRFHVRCSEELYNTVYDRGQTLNPIWNTQNNIQLYKKWILYKNQMMFPALDCSTVKPHWEVVMWLNANKQLCSLCK